MREVIVNILNNNYVFSVMSKVVGIISGILYTILLTRYLGPELKGESAIILNSVALFSAIMGLGVYQAYPRYKKLEGEILEEFASNIKGMFVLYCAFSVIVVLALSIDINMRIALILIPITIYIKQLNYIVLVEYPKRRNIASILLNGIDILLVSGLMFFTKAEYQVMVIFLFVKEILYLIAAIENVKLSFFSIKIKFTSLLKYVKYGFLQMIILMLMTINYRVDILMLDGNVAAAEIGIYSLGVNLAERIWLIPDALKDILISKLSKGKKEDEVAKVIRISLMFSLISIVFVIILGQTIIDLFFGRAFSKSYDITLIMLLGVIGMIFYKLVYSYNVVNGYRIVNFIFLGIAALINVFGNLIFIPLYGIQGAAYTSVISYLLCGFSFLMYFRYKSKIPYSKLLFLQKSDITSFYRFFQRK